MELIDGRTPDTTLLTNALPPERKRWWQRLVG